MGWYLDDVGRHPLLTRGGEIATAQAIEAGRSAARELDQLSGTPTTRGRRQELNETVRLGDQARERFVRSNLRLVVSIARSYRRADVPLADLIQEGNLGLMRAVEKYDWRKGFKFSTYATWWIRQSISRGIANSQDVIRVPIHARDHQRLVDASQLRLRRLTGRVPTRDELVEDTGLSRSSIDNAIRWRSRTVSLSEPLHSDSDAEVGDTVEDRGAPSPADLATEQVVADEVRHLLDPLEARERQILELRFGLRDGRPRTLEEVGVRFDVTRERVRQLQNRALTKLRMAHSPSTIAELLGA